MTENRARNQLKKMLRTLTPGSILHLLAETLRESAESAEGENGEQLLEQVKLVEATLFVVGLGIDATLPR